MKYYYAKLFILRPKYIVITFYNSTNFFIIIFIIIKSINIYKNNKTFIFKNNLVEFCFVMTIVSSNINLPKFFYFSNSY